MVVNPPRNSVITAITQCQKTHSCFGASIIVVMIMLIYPTPTRCFRTSPVFYLPSCYGDVTKQVSSTTAPRKTWNKKRIPWYKTSHHHVLWCEKKNDNKGFGSSSSSSSKISINSSNNKQYDETNPNIHLKRIYSAPALYDLAMSYRNYENEIEFLVNVHEQYSIQKKKPKSVIEIASGPARHCITALKNNYINKAIALDLSSEMVEYGMNVAKEELGSNDNYKNFNFMCDDMRSFIIEEPCDSAWILAGSLQHMTTNEDVIATLCSIHQALTPHGTLIIELPHPNELFNIIDSTTNGWEVPLEDDKGNECGELQVVWGDEDDDIDLIRQVRQNTVILNLKGVEDAEKQSVRGIVPLKLFTAQEMALFARCSGFEVVAMYGALSDEVDVNNEDIAYRLVCILRKE